MRLDFRFRGKISLQFSQIFNAVAIRIQSSFTETVDTVSHANRSDVDWWVSSPASRNVLGSPLFFYCCCVALLHDPDILKFDIREIVTDSKAFKKLLLNHETVRGRSIRVELLPRSRKRRRKRWYALVRGPAVKIYLYCLALLTRHLRRYPPSRDITLIDTFVAPDFIDRNRYYADLDVLSPKMDARNCWFVPTLSGFSWHQYAKAIRDLRKSGMNYLLPEDYLDFGDYAWAFMHVFRIRRLKIPTVLFMGTDISSLVKEEINSLRGGLLSYSSLLNYRFAKKLKRSDMGLNLIVNWFENQIIDKGWNAGFRRFYPETPTLGYQDFIIPSNYIWCSPSPEEIKNSVVPQEIIVTGEGMIDSVRRFCSDVAVRVVPAVRYQQIWRDRKFSPDPNYFTILFPLHLNMREIGRMLELLSLVDRQIGDDKLRWWIKPHPATAPKDIGRLGKGTWPGSFSFIGGTFQERMEQSDLVVGNTSSACLETLAKGTPVIILGNPGGFTFNPISDTITDDIWSLCYTEDEVASAIRFYRQRDRETRNRHETVGRSIRERFFAPMN